jgi:hypothetical protein
MRETKLAQTLPAVLLVVSQQVDGSESSNRPLLREAETTEKRHSDFIRATQAGLEPSSFKTIRTTCEFVRTTS